MGNEIQKVDVEKALKVLDDIAYNIRLGEFDLKARFTHMYLKAKAISTIKQAMTPEVIAQAFMPLMNLGDAGFGTDKEYPIDVIANVMTQAILTDTLPWDNEMMILKGKICRMKNHYRRKVRQFPGLSGLRIIPGAVRMLQGGASVDIKASWKLDGKPMSMECIGAEAIPVKLNEGMGQDGAIGKAERKLLTRIFNDLTGSNHDENELDEEEVDIDSLKVVKGTDTSTTESSKPQVSQTETVKNQVRENLAAKASAAAAADPAPPAAKTKTKPAAPKAEKPAEAAKPAAAEVKTETPKPSEPKNAATPASSQAPAPAPAKPAAPAANMTQDQIDTTISFVNKRKVDGVVVGYTAKDALGTEYHTESLELAQMMKKAMEQKKNVTIFYQFDDLAIGDAKKNFITDFAVAGDLVEEQPPDDDNSGAPEDQSAPVESVL